MIYKANKMNNKNRKRQTKKHLNTLQEYMCVDNL